MMEVAKKIKGARLRLRVQAIALLKKGWHQKDVAEAVGAGIRTVRDWAFRYNKEGIESLYNKPRSGAPRKLKDSIGFKQRVLAGSDYKQDNIVSWNGQKLQEVLRKEFNADYSLSGVYLVLYRLELRWLMPRPYHPKANTELQEAFKKTLKIK